MFSIRFFLALALAPSLQTTAEQSGFKKTGRHDETVRLCADFATAYPKKVRCIRFGQTPEGRPMEALIVSGDGVLDAAEARRQKRPVVLFQGGIHAGEIDGKDAGFLALRELLDGSVPRAAEILQKVTLVFVPVFNVDGHERFGPNHRPNQIGPEQMGWRTTSQNLNLNRDYAKAEAPEMAAMLRLLGEWDPIVYMDLHVTDGADFQHDVSVLIDPAEVGPPPLATEGLALRKALLSALGARGHLPTPFYPSFVVEDDPSSGFRMGHMPPRFSTPYWGLHNRFGMLVETHSWKDYATRVRATHDVIMATLDLAARDGRRWLEAAQGADRADARLAGQNVVLTWEPTGTSHLIDFRGYAVRREPSAVSGRIRVSYDRARPEIWHVPLFDQLAPKLTVRAPAAGYVVTAAYAGWMAEKLRLHGIAFSTLPSARAGQKVMAFRATEVTFAKEPYEGRSMVAVKGTWAAEAHDLAAGSLFVPIAQPRARLVLELLEPLAPDSFLAWGFFNGVFDRKEGMENYVAEAVAQRMLESDPALRAAFERKLAEDPEFARDGAKRLEFFAKRHPSWDGRFNLYPVYRVDRAPE